jgi:CRISPR-associated protein Csb2
VPLPFVGHSRASGAILGLALVLPRAASAEERRAVFAAVDAWEQEARLEDEELPRLALTMGRSGVLELERVEWAAVQTSLRPGTWCQGARIWHTATPVALDQNPGDLRSRDPNKLASAVAEATESLRRACIRIGLPEPASVEILPAPALAGAAKAKHYPPYPEQSGRTRRVLTHARLEFAEPVRGPLLLGAGRYHGLGLFRPEVSP